jgi:hypothetical protein
VQSPCNPLIEDYTEIFYMIEKGDIPSIQCKMSLGGPMSMRKVDGLGLIFLHNDLKFIQSSAWAA